MISTAQLNQLLQSAQIARESAFLLKNGHKVGAAILSSKDHIFVGCNIESPIFGLGSCAERVAINNAIAHGEYNFKALLVYDETPSFPCGACLQYLVPFSQISNNPIEIIIASENDSLKITTLDKLLPKAYKTKDPEKLAKLHSYKNK